jgi:hypothetical protein
MTLGTMVFDALPLRFLVSKIGLTAHDTVRKIPREVIISQIGKVLNKGIPAKYVREIPDIYSQV